MVSPEWIAERVARANEIFGVYGVQFEVVGRQALAERHAALETRADRDALGQYFARGTIHVFCVESLLDVDEPGRVRRGVHWRSTTHAAAHFVVVSKISGPDVLSHELGHYLGNPSHSDVAGNLMSYEHTDVLPFLDAKQQQRMTRTIASYLRSGELRALRAAGSARK